VCKKGEVNPKRVYSSPEGSKVQIYTLFNLGAKWNEPPIQWLLGFPGIMIGGYLATHPPSSVEVKERVELYFYSPSGPSWLVD